MSKERLVTSSYCYILSANFLLFFGFYLLMPVLPFYLTEEFGTGSGMAGAVLSCYTIAALSVRPFSGYLLDTFARKPLYLLAFFVFTSVFAGYLLAGTLTLFTILRVVHGFSFGMVTVAGNTVVIDIMPSSRRGEGLGYYGLANNIAMSVGPMVGLFLHDAYSFEVIFVCSLISCSLGFAMASLVKAPVKAPVKREPVSLDRFILVKGIPAGADLLMLSIPYGMTTTYVAMYARQIGITHGMGVFFTLMAVGMAISRIFSGRQVDKGRVTRVIAWGMYLVCLCFFALSSCALLMRLTEILLSVPSLLLVIFLQAIIGTPSAWSIALVISLTSWPSIAKVVRTEVRQLRASEYVIAAKCMGGSFFHILRCHLAPNFFSSILFMVVMNARSAIIAESTLSFMGLGLPIEVVTWGSMLSLAEKALMTDAWWILLIPGAFLVVTLLCITTLGDYLRSRTSRKESNL